MQSTDNTVGMVQAINAVPQATFEDFKALALQANKPSSSPADGLPVGGLRLTKVTVGADSQLAFSPDNIDALPGEVIRFSFNPKNHSVVQSSFDDPCHYLNDGFSSGFIPTEYSPSGVYFDVVVKDKKPVWFYCAQLGQNPHCQAGMVGSFNAPKEGKTLDAFRNKAKTASASTIPDHAPLYGVLSFKGHTITDLGGNVLNLDVLDPSMLSHTPPPGEPAPAYIIGMAGGGPPESYGWAPEMSDIAIHALQLLHYIDNILSTILLQGHFRLTDAESSWYGAYPEQITAMFGSMAAQSYVHRRTSTDCLQHYTAELVDMCEYHLSDEEAGVKPFLEQVLAISLLSVGATIDALAKIAETDAWLIPVLATQLGAKTRILALINMMQGHAPSAAPREVQIPMALAHSYIKTHYVSTCSSAVNEMEETWDATATNWPAMEIYDKVKIAGAMAGKERVVSFYVRAEGFDPAQKPDEGYYVVWIGPWGTMIYSPVKENGHVEVPTHLYGHVWAAVVKGKDYKLGDMKEHMVAGPEMVWISQP